VRKQPLDQRDKLREAQPTLHGVLRHLTGESCSNSLSRPGTQTHRPGVGVEGPPSTFPPKSVLVGPNLLDPTFSRSHNYCIRGVGLTYRLGVGSVVCFRLVERWHTCQGKRNL
jgi:hypothetical protein